MAIETAQSRPGELDVRKTSSSNLFVGLPDVTSAGTVAGITRDSKGRILSIDVAKLPAGPPGKPGVGKPGPAGPPGSSEEIEIAATENIAAFVAVIVTGKMANSSTLAHYGKVVGIARQATAKGFIIPIVISGTLTNPAWTWTAGNVIFLSGAGLSTTSPVTGFTQSIGVAKNPTTIVIELGEPILL
jgi:hypothetical protein